MNILTNSHVYTYKTNLINKNRQMYLNEKKSNNNLSSDFLQITPNSYYNKMQVCSFMKSKKKNNLSHNIDKYAGCIIGGAIGDAFGAPVEFMKLKKIKKRFGENGITYLTENKRNIINFTDDTQLTMFTADGLLKSAAAHHFNSVCPPDYDIMFDSYRTWYKLCAEGKKQNKGWISEIEDLQGTRGSGKTCMAALSQDVKGSIEEPLNNAKTSGGVMRSAPIGLMYYKNPDIAFDIGAKCAALTHGHPDGYLSAGTYAAIIANIVSGKNISEAVADSISILRTKENSNDLADMLEKAVSLSKQDDLTPSEAIKNLGQGWYGDEALAIAIYCNLKTPDDYKQVLIITNNQLFNKS